MLLFFTNRFYVWLNFLRKTPDKEQEPIERNWDKCFPAATEKQQNDFFPSFVHIAITCDEDECTIIWFWNWSCNQRVLFPRLPPPPRSFSIGLRSFLCVKPFKMVVWLLTECSAHSIIRVAHQSPLLLLLNETNKYYLNLYLYGAVCRSALISSLHTTYMYCSFM